ncbi:hypothetical protein J422_06633 [Methanocaldococcus villosus KIN24-T80]|uniref:NfeD-like C-terminal domain-containing protein n=1 Tax=Methanocaldococcus villosus KIN24-T80 TaxID=1069083 RepID=N6VP74_9EURY|nr:NfeD family protein [Methanocaldococcus villosus]ENN95665.1 hypothetical protein J422_06633 [Methanocaldococcus villosus KIN24-T80]
MLGYFYIILGVIIVAIESIIPGLYFPAIGIALIVYGILLILFPNPIFDVISAILAGVITAIILYYFVYSVKVNVKVGVEGYVGKRGRAVEDFKEGYGRVEIENQTWLAKSEDEIKKGDKIEVIGYEGVHLIVKKVTK